MSAEFPSTPSGAADCAIRTIMSVVALLEFGLISTILIVPATPREGARQLMEAAPIKVRKVLHKIRQCILTRSAFVLLAIAQQFPCQRWEAGCDV